MRKGLSIRILAILGLLVNVLPVQAQVPTAQQLEILRSMSPEDRDSLLQQLGIDGAVLGDLATGSGDASPAGDAAKRNAAAARRTPRDTFEFPPDKTFKPEDTLVLNIDFKKDKPARVESPGPGMTPITIPGEAAPVLSPNERADFEKLIALVRSRNPYQLDAGGAIHLPGFDPPVMLAGLDEEMASLRLSSMPEFLKLDLKVVRLPVRKTGVAGLKPFGYELFKDSTSTFGSVNDGPVPADYVVGPGDQINVQLFGAQNKSLRLVVGRDGRINFPELGPINVSGRSFERVAREIEQRVGREMIGVRASVGVGDTRSVRVFVVGEANRPGSYTVSGLATITSALYASGGVKPIGSLRNIQLKRQGAVVRHLDLYDLLLRGDTSDDAKLLPGDVIFIPPVAATVAVDGEVHRPAIYEIKDTQTVEDLVNLAGGPTTEADTSRLALVRVNDERARVVLDLRLDQPAGRRELVRNGDSIRVLRLRPTLDSGVVVEGHVFRAGPLAWRQGMRLTDALGSIEELRPNADSNYVLIRREMPPDRYVVALSADLGAALRDPSSASNVQLMPRDRIMVFDTEAGRQTQIAPLIEELRRQATITRPSEVVTVDGRVKARGAYPLGPGMRVSDLIRAGGGLQDSAYGSKAELTRFRLDAESRQTDLIEVDIAAIMRGDQSADVQLQPFDLLNVKEIPEWSAQEQITLLGEVRFPGNYPLRRGETLNSVLARAGGLTSLAFPEGAVFTRHELQEREQEQLNKLADRLQSDLAATALQAAAANKDASGAAISVGQTLLNQLKSTRAVGRLVIDVRSVLKAKPHSPEDVVLRDGDRLVIPKQKQEVTVIGEVQTTTSHFYRPDLSRDNYIAMSGGLTRKADRQRIYVVRADGGVVSSESSAWFRRSSNVQIKPGDTIVVPLDTERIPALPLWQAVTSILYNLAIAAAAANSF
jgi:polysaccharide biosynthesis/export protein